MFQFIIIIFYCVIICGEEGIKIGGQPEKILNKMGTYLKLVSDGEKYYIL
jgi:hypothetical protein